MSRRSWPGAGPSTCRCSPSRQAVRERAHKHADHETAIYIVAGRSGVRWGEDLENYDEPSAGSFVYIPANVPHMPLNLSDPEACTCVIARTDPNEQESVVLLPDLEARWIARQPQKA